MIPCTKWYFKLWLAPISIIAGLQSIPRESNDKDVVAMLEELTIEANEESFVIILQHGGNDVSCNPRITAISVNMKHLFANILTAIAVIDIIG